MHIQSPHRSVARAFDGSFPTTVQTFVMLVILRRHSAQDSGFSASSGTLSTNRLGARIDGSRKCLMIVPSAWNFWRRFTSLAIDDDAACGVTHTKHLYDLCTPQDD